MEKKFSKTIVNPKTGRKNTVRYGAKGYTIKPGTKAGDSYCARSLGIAKKHPKAKNPNSPNSLSRKKWKCKGDKSMK
jgi:ribosomal protein L13E